ncbi:hypothetical protein PVT71_18260 [Salipiger sp. H15]|uniref:DUF6950 domain-containing protein n=1 Tax=Alloyangia sp. H15 TaxID=3029062 RepID=A0AAU8AQE8_9RHOB
MASVITSRAALGAALEHMSGPWVWGSADCCTSACNAFLALHSIDPMACLRGTYQSFGGARRMIASFGGFLPMCEHLAERYHLTPGSGLPGELGVVQLNNGRHALALGTGTAWQAKSPAGTIAVPSVLRSWNA